MTQFILEHPDGGQFYSQFGWSPHPAQALRFASVTEAEDHMLVDRCARGARVTPAEMREDAGGNRLPDQVRTDYNPWGDGR